MKEELILIKETHLNSIGISSLSSLFLRVDSRRTVLRKDFPCQVFSVPRVSSPATPAAGESSCVSVSGCGGVASHRPCCHGTHQGISSSCDGLRVPCLPHTSSDTPFQYIPTAIWRRSGSASHFRNRWHQYRGCRDSSCMASTLLPAPPADSVFSDGRTGQVRYHL